MVDKDKCGTKGAHNTWDQPVIKSRDAQSEPEHSHVKALIVPQTAAWVMEVLRVLI